MRVRGTVRPPGDKSVTHRALIVAGLIRGDSEIVGALASEDARSTARVLRRLGVGVGPLRGAGAVRVSGAEWRQPEATLHCGNSGTTARLLLGALAGQPITARLSGDASLRRRPMRRVAGPLEAMGASIEHEVSDGLPLCITGGRLRPLAYEMPIPSAQVKTALLLAGLVAGVDVTVREPAPTRDHTERMLGHLGVDVQVDGSRITLCGGAVPLSELQPFRVVVPGDTSSAAFLIGVALLADGGELRLLGVGVNPTRTGVLAVLRRMGASIERDNVRDVCGEPVADLVVRPAQLEGTVVPAGEIPGVIDEIPVLAVLASRARGETRFHGVGELRLKESDRLESIARNLRSVGAQAAVEGDDLVVYGGEAAPRGPVDTGGDHRLTLAFAVLGTLAGAAITLSETGSAAISYPRFFDDLHRISEGG